MLILALFLLEYLRIILIDNSYKKRAYCSLFIFETIISYSVFVLFISFPHLTLALPLQYP